MRLISSENLVHFTEVIAIVGLCLEKRWMRVSVSQVVLEKDLPTVEELKDIILDALALDAITITTLSGALDCKGI